MALPKTISVTISISQKIYMKPYSMKKITYNMIASNNK